jgi:hypothetical protein
MRTSPVFFALVLAGALGCGNDRTTKYPGQLGAPCSVDTDCNNGMLCSKVHLAPPDDLPRCFATCLNADSECPADSFCDSSYASMDGAPAQMIRTCWRQCDSTEFCRDLHPDTNICKVFSDGAAATCGIKN